MRQWHCREPLTARVTNYIHIYIYILYGVVTAGPVRAVDPAGCSFPPCSTEIAVEDAPVISVHVGDPAGSIIPSWSAQMAVGDAAASPVPEDDPAGSTVQSWSAEIAVEDAAAISVHAEDPAGVDHSETVQVAPGDDGCVEADDDAATCTASVPEGGIAGRAGAAADDDTARRQIGVAKRLRRWAGRCARTVGRYACCWRGAL